MSTKLTLGICKKVGQPAFGSVGANCNLEVELDPDLLKDDLALFHQQVRKVYAACRQAVDEELARCDQAEPRPMNSSNSRGRTSRPATIPQSRAIRSMAARQGVDLTKLLNERFGVTATDNLSLSDASQLIDELKASLQSVAS